MNSRNGLRNITPVNTAIIIINVITFIVLEILGDTNSAWFMYEHGAAEAESVMVYHEYWRLITCMFMHFGIRHLVNNMLILFVLGDNLERALGKIKYLLFYLTCGVLANVISLLWEIWFPGSRMVVSAGASGAIFGVIGGLLYVVGVNRGRLEDLSSRQLATMVLFSLYFGFTSTGVNNVAHVGGLVSGIVMAWILYRRPQRSEWWMKEDF